MRMPVSPLRVTVKVRGVLPALPSALSASSAAMEKVDPLGAAAAQLYGLMNAAGRGQQDFSGIIRLLAGK